MLADSLYYISRSLTVQILPSLLLVVVLTHLVYQWLRFRRIPGPFLAKFTDLWRFLNVRRGHAHETYFELHQKHGDVVRIGPNCISVSKPDVMQEIYGINKGYVKSKFYSPWQNIVNGKRAISLVFTQDEAIHAKIKRSIAFAFSLSTLVEFEPLLDTTTALFLSRLDELYAGTKKVCDLGTWLQWYAFDVMGELTFSKRLGFLDRAQDVESIISSISTNAKRCATLGQMPWLDPVTYKNPLYLKFFAKPITNPVIAFGQRRLRERLDDEKRDWVSLVDIKDPALKEKMERANDDRKPDFLTRYLKVHEEKPELVTDTMLLALLFSNINAGSDTVASTVRAIFYHLLKNPETMTKLKDELDEAVKAGDLNTPLPTWNGCQKLPYLNAVIKEALRINPALSLPMERIVPSPGLDLGSVYLPPGTVVGINPWVLHRDKRIFGDDAEKWRPERWLSNTKGDEDERIKYMDQNLLSFSAGSRTCLGRHIAMLELSKMVPALLLRYDIRLAEPEKEWTTQCIWIIKQDGLDVILEKRT